MENAGRAVADAVTRRTRPAARVMVLAGPGNNGGDGFVAARLLALRGYRVEVVALAAPSTYRGDAGAMAARWSGPTTVLMGAGDPSPLADADVIIDALFGAGLSRPLDGPAARLVEYANASRATVVAVDVPSGLDGTTGVPTGPVIDACETVTFFRLKPGHLLMPGRDLCGQVTLADIGIPDAVLSEVGHTALRNGPAVWGALFPSLQAASHKYTRGHALVLSGPATATGAARLAAEAALRCGAGLVTMGASGGALAVLAAHVTSIMITEIGSPRALSTALSDTRRNAILIGPGAGVGTDTAELVLAALASPAAATLDADALTSFAPGEAAPTSGFGFTARHVATDGFTPQRLFEAIRARDRAVVLTPHEGEFRRLFGDLPGSKLERARTAAATFGATVVLKGADTVIAGPDGRAAINDNAPAWLATAGSGDVLAGIVTGLIAQGMPGFEASCAAVWLHGRAARERGPGLMSQDLPGLIPAALADLT